MKKRGVVVFIVLIIVGVLVAGGAVSYFLFLDSSLYVDESTGVSIEFLAGWEIAEITLGDKILSAEDGSAFVAVSKYEDFERRGIESAEEFADAFLESFGDIELINSSRISVAGVGAVARTFSFDEGEIVKVKMVVTEKSEGYFYLFNFISSESTFDKEEVKFDEMLTSVELE